MDLYYRIRRSFNLENNVMFKIIENDNLGISKRIKTIDKNLVLVVNLLQGKYEIHDVTQKDSTFALSFSNLNQNILDTLNKVKHRNTISVVREQKRLKNRYEEHKKSSFEESRRELILSEDLMKRI